MVCLWGIGLWMKSERKKLTRKEIRGRAKWEIVGPSNPPFLLGQSKWMETTLLSTRPQLSSWPHSDFPFLSPPLLCLYTLSLLPHQIKFTHTPNSSFQTLIGIYRTTNLKKTQIQNKQFSDFTAMSCTVAVSNSPVFSPSHHQTISTFFSANLSPRPLSPLAPNPFRQSIAGDGPSTSGSSPSAVLLKRKRPARLDIPIMQAGFGAPATPRAAQDPAVEEERDGFYSVYCKRGRRAALEDRFSAMLDVQGDPKQVFFLLLLLFFFSWSGCWK